MVCRRAQATVFLNTSLGRMGVVEHDIFIKAMTDGHGVHGNCLQ